MNRIEPTIGDYEEALKNDPTPDPALDINWDIEVDVEDPDMTSIYKRIEDGSLVEIDK